MYDTMYDSNCKGACTRSHLQVVNEHNRPVSDLFTWTVLNRKDKLKVLQTLLDTMSYILPEEDAKQIGKIMESMYIEQKHNVHTCTLNVFKYIISLFCGWSALRLLSQMRFTPGRE